ncbi:glycosyltransferase family 2 protein [Litoreibacter halocynthiae]|uniref:glycosyltransferase family 2 protein n=1 Tax=Litoreibacter halocynthiae TaxID=1242689 RepID=UPI002492802A|nr:glycosyltransferase [Litoreibacter halocynthiae]
MNDLSVSVVVVSRHRPDHLRRCVRALEFQTQPSFEVVLVTDSETSEVLTDLVPHDWVKSAICNEANISKARNIGIGLAAGEAIAFIDDDAIAEPTWLERLIEPFSDPNVAASGGFVRGRNGISFQWRAEEIGADGVSHPISIDGTAILKARPGKGVKTQGTNCAFRRDILIELHGFDENYKFYLDESDLNMRIGQAGHLTAIVPNAEVQHGYAVSSLRGNDRRPKSLFEIGASQAYFLKKFGRPASDLTAFRESQWARLEAALVKGLLEPRDVRHLRDDLEAGIVDGHKRPPTSKPDWPIPSPFKPFLSDRQAIDHCFIASRWLSRRRAYADGKSCAERGVPCTAIILSPTAVFHQRWFHDDGFWVQSGGIFGKSSRTDRIWSWLGREKRFRRERKLLQRTR